MNVSDAVRAGFCGIASTVVEDKHCKDEVCRYCKNALYCPIGDGEYITLCKKKVKECCPDFEIRSELYSPET